eukprot:487906-Rhodomonas_salina.2
MQLDRFRGQKQGPNCARSVPLFSSGIRSCAGTKPLLCDRKKPLKFDSFEKDRKFPSSLTIVTVACTVQ